MSNFRNSDRHTGFLLLPSVDEWLPENHLARFIVEVIEKLNANQVKVVIATGQLIGEGFDCRELTTLFLATPISFSGRVLQYLGRVLRPAPGKELARVYDYVDVHVGVLKKAAETRQRVYQD